MRTLVSHTDPHFHIHEHAGQYLGAPPWRTLVSARLWVYLGVSKLLSFIVFCI